MRIKFTGSDGGICVNLISDKNLNAMILKHPDLVILEQNSIPYYYNNK